jgi:hypothetical protein
MLLQFRQAGAQFQTSRDAEQIRSRYLNIVARERAMDAVLDSRAKVNQKDAQPQQFALIAEFARRNPCR